MLTYNPPQTPFLNVLHEDADLLVLNKPSGLLSVPGRALDHKDSLLLRVEQQFGEAHAVHRLDMETSGIMVVARNKATLSNLSKQFQARQTDKRYVARVWGYIAESEGEVDLPLICDWPNRPRQMVDHEVGKPSQTKWRVLEREEGGITRVSLTPITGRSHQLRVHLQAIGHPILGDPLYANEAALKAASRLQLHAEMLAFHHPQTEQVMTMTCRADF